MTASFDDVRRIALGLPETEEVLAWGTEVTFRVRAKIFVIGARIARRTFRSSRRRCSRLTWSSVMRRPSGRRRTSGGSAGSTVDLARVDAGELESLIRHAWRLTAPKRLAATLPET